MRARQRLDSWLVQQGLVESREKAQALIMAGRVRVAGQPVDKPGRAVRDDEVVELHEGPRHVGRGALKLEGALDAFDLELAGAVAIDLGASTGGFTQTLLARGATKVYAVDVGRGQLHERLSGDPRVVVLDRTNARNLTPREVPEACDVATLDLSFISVLKVLPALREVLREGGRAAVLVKPQFEVGRGKVGRGGLVKDPALHAEALRGVAHGAQETLGYGVRGACASPILGAKGNREFFLLLEREGAAIGAAELERLIGEAVDS